MNKEARERYTKIAEAGNPEMQLFVGYMYLSGTGYVLKNEEEALYWYRMATDQCYESIRIC